MDNINFKGSTPEILNNCKILIIEDDRTQRLILRQMFENLGFINIYEAEDGKIGLDKTFEINPDLVLLDMRMPVMDGFEYCKTVRKNPDYKDITILVLTCLTDLYDKARIFGSGATDYITKPVDFNELAARSFVHLERVLHVKKLEAFSVRVNKELQSTKQLLELILPGTEAIESLKKQYKIDLASAFKSSHEMGGDFWGFEKLDNHRLAIYCLDFSGHGIDSALNAVRVHSILTTNENKPSNPGELLNWLNNKLVELLPKGNFATMFYGIIDTKTDTITYATASSPSPVLLYKNSFPAMVLSGNGYPLGAIKNVTFEAKTVSFKAGDTLLLYSDALFEVETTNGGILGEDKLIDMFGVFTKSKKFESKKSLDSFLKTFYNTYGRHLKDDLTMNVYHRMN